MQANEIPLAQPPFWSLPEGPISLFVMVAPLHPPIFYEGWGRDREGMEKGLGWRKDGKWMEKRWRRDGEGLKERGKEKRVEGGREEKAWRKEEEGVK